MRAQLTSIKLKRFMTQIAREAGEVQLHYYNKRHQIKVKPGAGIVTEADTATEKVLLRRIFKNFPESSVITEESGEHHRGKSLCWILDPIDGTSNYAHGFPWFCVSIALYQEGKPRAGVIYHPTAEEMFYAEVGQGCFLNGRSIRVSKASVLRESLLGTGFYYSRGPLLEEEVEIFRVMAEKSLAVRRPGSAALDLACVASGRYDGFWERGLSSWDVAAGFILVEEAGGKISDYAGKATTIHNRQVIATNGHLHKKMVSLIQESLNEQRRSKKVDRTHSEKSSRAVY